ncbi:MAG: hypothetical protein GX585_01035 [Clostridiales bacterium]|nr:hypothetical protein [Clostridiales bacterium]
MANKSPYTLRQPELLHFPDREGRIWQGCSRTWLSSEDRRKTGSATAAAQLAYLSTTQMALSPLYPHTRRSAEALAAYMETLSLHFPADRGGLTSPHTFITGIRAFAAQRGRILHTRELDVPRFRIARPSFSQCAAFLRTGLSANCPIAFLSLSRGRTLHLENREWVLITALEEQTAGRFLCTVLKDGRARAVDLQLWYQTTRAGGMMVYFLRDNAT